MAYYSQKLLPREQYYATNEKERSADFQSVHHRSEVYDTSITNTTEAEQDERYQCPSDQVVLIYSTIDFKIQHQPGKANGNVDG